MFNQIKHRNTTLNWVKKQMPQYTDKTHSLYECSKRKFIYFYTIQQRGKVGVIYSKYNIKDIDEKNKFYEELSDDYNNYKNNEIFNRFNGGLYNKININDDIDNLKIKRVKKNEYVNYDSKFKFKALNKLQMEYNRFIPSIKFNTNNKSVFLNEYFIKL
jgi:hypothetical protein